MKIETLISFFGSKAKWIFWHCRSGLDMDIPFRKANLSGLKVRVNGNGQLRVGVGMSCRKQVIFNLSSGGAIEIGENVFINDGCRFNAREKIQIGKGTIFGQNVMIYDHDHNYRDLSQMRNDFLVEKITIGENVWIGSNVIILRGSTVGDGAVIGAGTIIKGDIPPNTMVYNSRELVQKKIRK